MRHGLKQHKRYTAIVGPSPSRVPDNSAPCQARKCESQEDNEHRPANEEFVAGVMRGVASTLIVG
jgi:hypothetical protein